MLRIVTRFVGRRSRNLWSGCNMALMAGTTAAVWGMASPKYGPRTDPVWPAGVRALGQDSDLFWTPDGDNADPDFIPNALKGNEQWRKSKLDKDPEYFERLSKGQSPKVMYIGCADSRVQAEGVLGMHSGDAFVQRNVGNLVVCTDLSLLTSVKFALSELKIKNIMVCGHYGCAAVGAASESARLGFADNWLNHIFQVKELYWRNGLELLSKSDREKKLVELNVARQCFNLAHSSVVRRHIREGGEVTIHGCVYDMPHGTLIPLEVNKLLKYPYE